MTAVKQNGSALEGGDAHKAFDLENVHSCFSKACLESEEVLLDTYLNAWQELNRFLNTLGTLFTFVTHDVQEKVHILEAYLKAEPDHYKTINSLLQYEVDNKITKTKKPSASRTLLRLHRALAYILSMFEKLVTASNDAKFLNTLGTLFTFVTHDVQEKVHILEAYLKAEPDHYKTINSLLQYEVDNKITKTKKPSASRTLLRLHRALAYILSMFEKLVTASNDAKVSTISREAYDATLSKHHTWIVRKACNLAMYSLPLRSTLLNKIDPSDGAEQRITADLKNITISGSKVYEITESLYTQYKLHDLP